MLEAAPGDADPGDADPGDAALDEAVLGIELGSTNIKAVLIDRDHRVLASGSHAWENRFVDGRWTYALDDVRAGVQAAYAALAADAERGLGARLTSPRAIGISAMMHGYLALDGSGELLTPFRTWRNTDTGEACAQLTEALGVNIPHRWSVAHLHQAVLDGEPHVADLVHLTTLAGYVHHQLTGQRVLGVGDASGMFPVLDGDWDADRLARYDQLTRDTSLAGRSLRDLLPDVLHAGEDAGTLTAGGAAWLDPTGSLQPGALVCPPEGDAGTGMVATDSVATGTANVSAGTSIFAMVVLPEPLTGIHREIDLVTTPDGAPVAMVHCNNGASELEAWVRLLIAAARETGVDVDEEELFGALVRSALRGDTAAGGLLACNYLAGEPVTGLDGGRPLVVRAPDSSLTLPNLMRAQIYSVFATLRTGLDILTAEGVQLRRVFAHGGLFRTPVVAQQLLAASLETPVSVGAQASAGGAWGIAVLAAYAAAAADEGPGRNLAGYLAERVFGGADVTTLEPRADDVAGFRDFHARWTAGLAVERAAVEHL